LAPIHSPPLVAFSGPSPGMWRAGGRCRGDLAHGRAAPMQLGWVALGSAIRGARARERQRWADEIGEGDEIDRWAIATVLGGS
jgi:hypothetical protein